MPSGNSNTSSENTENAFDSTAARDFLTTLFGQQKGMLATFGIWRELGNEDKKDPVTNEKFFLYPDDLDAALTWFSQLANGATDDGGHDLYMCAHLLQAVQGRRERKKINALKVSALWMDLDHNTIPDGAPQPSIIVESSPGRWQCYYRLTAPILPDKAEELNKRLALLCGADPSGADLTQLLRVPGTRNHKYKERPVVRVIHP